MPRSATLAALAAVALAQVACSAKAEPAYTAAGELIPPADYRDWMFLSSSLDMNYSKTGMAMDSIFDNVFVDPAAWAAFKATGRWPDKTVFVKENRLAGGKSSINEQGHFQTERVAGAEVHVRDDARFKGGWGFFAMAPGGKPAKLIPYQASCYSCHQQHGALDTTFTQFYPTAKPIAIKAGTYTER